MNLATLYKAGKKKKNVSYYFKSASAVAEMVEDGALAAWAQSVRKVPTPYTKVSLEYFAF